ncbi:hypothetical protein EG68_09212 [Paragonimus skrjabini miyazakii]|uniref:MD-2-related lipid-recognition domain-containing protein n=1 Tax=Paragonimus skrjabini miyazakii TaxID=59628 RepID=A0A8S9YGX9_9TREM|nr:hypothetical protein EG68_09212 [Paragonimus skrjabini miyazakii]
MMGRPILSLILFQFCLTAVHLLNTQFEDCGSTVAQIINVTVSPCNEKPCALRRRHHSELAIMFNLTEPVNPGKALVTGDISGIAVPFALGKKNVCAAMTPSCPLNTSIPLYNYSMRIPVRRQYPAVSLLIE